MAYFVFVVSFAVGAFGGNKFAEPVTSFGFFGGKYENMHTSKKETEPQKTVVIGMVERNSKQVKAMKVPTAEKDFLLPKINLNIESGATIITDTYHAYNDLKRSITIKQ